MSDRLKRLERYYTELIRILNSINIGDNLVQDPLVGNLPHNRYLLPEKIIPVNISLFILASWIASSGITAMLLAGGRTTHSALKLPLNFHLQVSRHSFGTK